MMPALASAGRAVVALHTFTAVLMELLTDPQAWIAFLTLLALEMVLGVDNIVFISILAGKLPPEQRKNAPARWASAWRSSRDPAALLARLDRAADGPAVHAMGHAF